MEINPIVVGTAGHIDHGKSTLVRALTGIDPDRLKEEKERGLTIDLGFAPLRMPDGRTIGIVDVPGHERFIRNMVAGATGIDLVVLVVAADDGVMPQTREHLAIMGILGVRHGLVALNKIDLVEEGLAELAAEEVREALAGTFLAAAPIVPVSARGGAGLDALRAALFDLAGRVEPRSADRGVFRMPVQRVFTKQGFGTVLTGIPVSGRCALGDVLEVQPSGQRGRVRALQAYREETTSARAGHSTAINLSDVDHRAVHRGAVVATPGFFRPVRMIGARVTALAHLARPVENRCAVRVHTGTAEAVGELILLDVPRLEPGGEGLAQLRLADAVVVAPGDRFVLRLASPLITLGGGVVLEESRWRLKRFKDFVVAGLTRQEESLDSLAELLSVHLERAGDLVPGETLAHVAKIPLADVRGVLSRLAGEGRVRADAKDRWLAATSLKSAEERVLAAATEYFADAAHLSQVDASELRRRTRLAEDVFDLALHTLVDAGKLVQEGGGKVRVPGREARLSPAERELWQRIRERLSACGLQPPSPAELAAALGGSERAVRGMLAGLVDAGEVVRVGGDLFIAAPALDAAREAVVRNCQRHGELQIPELRDELGTSRKFLIPILEWFDARGVTLRQGARRILKKR